jgi:hypothetical protein
VLRHLFYLASCASSPTFWTPPDPLLEETYKFPSTCQWMAAYVQHTADGRHRIIRNKCERYRSRYTRRCHALLTASQRGLQPPHSWGFEITHNDTPQSVGPHWTSDRPVAETSTWQHKTLTIDRLPCPGGIRNRNPSRRGRADPRPRPLSHSDRQVVPITFM